MKFILYRDPNSKIQKIPYAAMQTAELVHAKKLVLYSVAGSVLLCRDTVSLREAVGIISHLNEVVDSLVLQMVNASNEAAGTLKNAADPLGELEKGVLDALIASGADPDGLRLLLAQEDDDGNEK